MVPRLSSHEMLFIASCEICETRNQRERPRNRWRNGETRHLHGAESFSTCQEKHGRIIRTENFISGMECWWMFCKCHIVMFFGREVLLIPTAGSLYRAEKPSAFWVRPSPQGRRTSVLRGNGIHTADEHEKIKALYDFLILFVYKFNPPFQDIDSLLLSFY